MYLKEVGKSYRSISKLVKFAVASTTSWKTKRAYALQPTCTRPFCLIVAAAAAEYSSLFQGQQFRRPRRPDIMGRPVLSHPPTILFTLSHHELYRRSALFSIINYKYNDNNLANLVLICFQ